MVSDFAPGGVLVMGIDDTIERRWGKRIAARGIYREERTSLVIATLLKPVDGAG